MRLEHQWQPLKKRSLRARAGRTDAIVFDSVHRRQRGGLQRRARRRFRPEVSLRRQYDSHAKRIRSRVDHETSTIDSRLRTDFTSTTGASWSTPMDRSTNPVQLWPINIAPAQATEFQVARSRKPKLRVPRKFRSEKASCKSILSMTSARNVSLMLVTTGDNDSTDCQHVPIEFDLQVSFAPR